MQSVVESFESTFLVSAVHWTCTGGNTLWSNAANWNTGMIPGAADDVTINVGGNPTITSDGTTGTVSIGSLASSDPMVISGGSLTITGATR